MMIVDQLPNSGFFNFYKENIKDIESHFLNSLNEFVLKEGKFPYTHNRGIGYKLNYKNEAVHSLLFAAFSLWNKKKFSKILELGTHEGSTTMLLSHLFKDSEIITLELPEKFIFEESLAHNISKCPNVTLYREDSFFAPRLLRGKVFDLIWIDANHLLPNIAWDLAYSINNINPGGFILVDDCINDPKDYDVLSSGDAFKTVVDIAKTFGIPHCFVKKRQNNRAQHIGVLGPF